MVRPGAATARVELADADTIEHAWADWHKAITATRPDEAAERKAAKDAELARIAAEQAALKAQADAAAKEAKQRALAEELARKAARDAKYAARKARK